MPNELMLETIVQKDPINLTSEEIDYLKDHKSQLTDDQIKKFESVLKNNEDDGDDGNEAGNRGENQ